MKKLLLIVTGIAVFLLSGCSMFSSEFEKAVDNMNNLDSMTMRMTIDDVLGTGDIITTYKIDGNKIYNREDGENFYAYYEGDKIYMVEDFMDGTYAFEVQESYIEDRGPYTEFGKLYEDDFEINDEGFYVLTKSIEGLEDTENFRIKIEDEYITELRFEITVFTITIDYLVEFFNFDDTEINLPEFEIPSDLIMAHKGMSNLGYLYNLTEEGFIYEKFYGADIVYNNGEDSFLILDFPNQEIYFPEDDTIMGDTLMTLEEYYDNGNAMVPEEALKHLKTIYEEMIN